MNAFTGTGWRKSSYSNSSANCVEVAPLAAGRIRGSGAAGAARVGVRDSKQHGSGPVLEFTMPAWRSFLAGLKAGRHGQ